MITTAEHAPIPQEPSILWHGYLDATDPIDRLLQEYVKNPLPDQFPKPSEEHIIIGSLQHGKIPVTDLVRIYKSLIAGVARPFKGSERNSGALLLTATHALHEAAINHDSEQWFSFADHAIISMEAALNDTDLSETVDLAVRPMDKITSYLEEIRQAETIRAEILGDFSPLQQKVLPLLHLPNKQIAEKLDTSTKAVKTATQRCMAKTASPNRTDLALKLHAKGLRYPIPEPTEPLVELLTNEYLDIAKYLGSEDEKTATIVSQARHEPMTAKQVAQKVRWMKTKTGMQTRAGLALLVKMHDTGERRETSGRPPSKSLARKLGLQSLKGCDVEGWLMNVGPKARAIIKAFYLADESVTWRDVGEQFALDGYAAHTIAKRGIKTLRRALAAKEAEN